MKLNKNLEVVRDHVVSEMATAMARARPCQRPLPCLCPRAAEIEEAEKEAIETRPDDAKLTNQPGNF
jgi:hypothetical protein